jgi:hypothetical protein
MDAWLAGLTFGVLLQVSRWCYGISLMQRYLKWAMLVPVTGAEPLYARLQAPFSRGAAPLCCVL